MYLSRLVLDMRDRKVQRTLENPYRLHQALLLGFPPQVPGGGGRVLFRVEPERDDGRARVLVQSALCPDWRDSRLRERLPLARADEPKELSLALLPQQSLRFRLRANPTRRSGGKRLPVLGEEAQAAWVRRKLEAAGLEPAALRCRDEGMMSASRGGSGGSPRMAFISVLYEGLVRVKEPPAVRAAVAGGIGSGKAFGFGMLSLATP